jgi:Putative MetA-pathway of phenol degradation
MPSPRLTYILLLITFALLFTSRANAQIPFYTDDADTTEKGKFHFEFFNEHDWLQRSSRPALRQNLSNFTVNYGLTDRIELGINFPVIKILSSQDSLPRDPVGIGDTQIGAKLRLLDEKQGSWAPATSVAFYVELPTGSVKKQIGSGLTDCFLYGVLQKSLTKRTKARLNGGILFTGNSSTGLIGIHSVRGQVFTGNASLVRDFTPKLRLGLEVFGGVTNNFNLSRGQLESQVGGSYAVRENLAFTFAVLGGRFPASPLAGFHLGLVVDFK